MPSAFPIQGEITGLTCPKLPAFVGNCKIAHVAFHSNTTPQPRNPDQRLTIRDVAVYECQHWVCDARGVVFEDVTITDVRGGGPGAMGRSYLWGCVFSHVRIGGWISGVLWRWQVDPADNEKSRRFLWANLERYTAIDWALDITEARFSFDQSLLGVPSRLVRRDPEKHLVMTRDAALRFVKEHQEVDVWRIGAQELIETGLEDTVCIVGGSGKALREKLAEAKELVEQGFLA